MRSAAALRATGDSAEALASDAGDLEDGLDDAANALTRKHAGREGDVCQQGHEECRRTEGTALEVGRVALAPEVGAGRADDHGQTVLGLRQDEG